MALTATKGSRKPFTVHPLKNSAPPSDLPAATRAAGMDGAEPRKMSPEQKLARIKENFEPLGVTLEQLEKHLGKDPLAVSGKVLREAFEHFETIHIGPGDDFIADYDAEQAK